MNMVHSRRFVLSLVAASAFVATSFAVLPHASAADGAENKMNVRGSVVSLSGNTLQVKSRDGKMLNVALADGFKVSGVTTAGMADIQPGSFVGIASLPKADGGSGALEVLVFPPAMKGTGEGSYAWDLQPNSSMTNATVANAVKGVDGHTVTVTYHGKEKKIDVPPGTPIVTFGPATRDDLVPGAVVFIPAIQDAKGGLAASRLVVGTKGVVPPM